MHRHESHPPRFSRAVRGIIPTVGLALSVSLWGQSLDWKMVDAVDRAEHQFSRLALSVLSGNPERSVHYTTAAGSWRTQSDAVWTSGFVPGSFWYLYALTDGRSQWEVRGRQWDEGVRSRAYATDNDTGFQILDSFGTALDLEGPVDVDAYTQVILDGAKTLTDERWNATIGAYRAWDAGVSNPTQMPFEVNVDMIMNMEMILWAAENGGPAAYRDYAIAHADQTWEDLVREDGSTFHVVEYASDGSVVRKRTHQGWKADSTWSRGQAWAVYGFTMTYRYTELPRMLERAEATFDYFVTATDEDADDAIPYSDFDAPLDSQNPRDSSAAAIVASAALELYAITGDQKYWDRAMAILHSLTTEPYLTSGTRYQSLVAKASEKWGEPEVGAIFADFYLLESIWRYWTWFPAELGNWYDYSIRPGSLVRTGRWLRDISIVYRPWIYLQAIPQWGYAHETETADDGLWIYMSRP